jgi:hypothetical protein
LTLAQVGGEWQLHTLATLSLVKDPLVLIRQEAWWAPELSGHGEENILEPRPRPRPPPTTTIILLLRSLSHPARSQSLYRLRYPSIIIIIITL